MHMQCLVRSDQLDRKLTGIILKCVTRFVKNLNSTTANQSQTLAPCTLPHLTDMAATVRFKQFHKNIVLAVTVCGSSWTWRLKRNCKHSMMRLISGYRLGTWTIISISELSYFRRIKLTKTSDIGWLNGMILKLPITCTCC